MVVVDNLSLRKGAKVAQLLVSRCLYLPPCSPNPNSNSIEQAFAKLAHLSRLARHRTTETLRKKIGELPDRFEQSERAACLMDTG